ncbi:MAG: ABC transporter substrate-binding protein [Proteobacteria bacterium]|nr:ABC transporter substrate-binding protein [Pseudomonadota bacterium]
MKKIILLISCLWSVLLFSSAQATIQTAGEVVMSTADAVLARVTSEREAIDADPGRIYSLVDDVVIPHFDFVSMSKWVLGKKSWHGASKSQQEQFIGEFRTLLVRTYAKVLLEYANQEIEYFPEESNPNSNLVVVKTKIRQAGRSAVPIDYRMHISGGEWKVVDIVVDGVSLILTYRGSFASEIRKNGLDALISKLSKRNDAMVNSVVKADP